MPPIEGLGSHLNYEALGQQEVAVQQQPAGTAQTVQPQSAVDASQTDQSFGFVVEAYGEPGPQNREETQSEAPAEKAILPRLNTLVDFGVVQKDLDSPKTPEESVMASYADPMNLAGPTKETNARVSYGSVDVPKKKVNDYEEIRKHMAKSAKGRKYLAAAENAPGKMEVYPYSDGKPPKALGEKGVSYPAAVQAFNKGRFFPGLKRDKAIVTFPTDQGMVTREGGTISAATNAAHEIGHAVRMNKNEGMGMYGHIDMNNGWHNSEENFVIRNLEADIANVNGETGNRDEHSDAGFFRTNHITSSVPKNQGTARLLAQHAPRLQELTAAMDKEGTGPYWPSETAHPLLDQRSEAARTLQEAVAASENRADTLDMAQRGMSTEAIVAHLGLSREQVHQTLASTAVEMNGQGVSPEAIVKRLHLPPQQVYYALARHHTVNMAEQGISSETIATRLHVSPDDVSRTLDHAVVEMNGQGMTPEAIANRLNLPPDQVLTTISETGVVQTAHLMAANGMPVEAVAQAFGKTQEEIQGILSRRTLPPTALGVS